MLHNKPNNVEVCYNCILSKLDYVSFCLAEIKHRSSSLDHSSHSHRRRLQSRTTVPIRAPYVSYISNITEENISSFSESDDE